MREITSHKVNGCNEKLLVETDDALSAGGSPTKYWITLPPQNSGPNTPTSAVSYDLRFQDGPPAEGINGITHETLIAVVIDRLQAFQRGPFSCRENALALTKLEEAAMWLNSRTRERTARGVEGTVTK